MIDIVIPSGDSNLGLGVSVNLNLTHALNHSATTAGFILMLTNYFFTEKRNNEREKRPNERKRKRRTNVEARREKFPKQRKKIQAIDK